MAAIDQSGHFHRALRKQEYDRKLEQEERAQLWTLIWVLFGFKAVSIGILVYWIEWDEVKDIVGLTTWPWFVVPAVALTPPLLNRLRMRRMRRKRAALRRAEFEIDPAHGVSGERTISLLDAQGLPMAGRDGSEPV